MLRTEAHPGLRITLGSHLDQHRVTMCEEGPGQRLVMRKDNSEEGVQLQDWAPSTDVTASEAARFHYKSGSLLLVIRDGQLVDAQVKRWLGFKHGNRHLCSLLSALSVDFEVEG